MKSPITGSDNCSLVATFPAEKIKTLYLSGYSVNVERFFKDVTEVELYKCNDTGYRFYYPFDIFGDGRFYDELNKGLEIYYIEERWEHTQALKLLSSKMEVLEIGCGDGFFLELMLKKQIACTGLELNQAAVEKCKAKGLTVFNRLIEEFCKANENKFDAVCFFQVLEHITDIHSFLTAALKCLKAGGLLIIGVPNNNPYIFKHDMWHTLNLPPHHAGLWNKTAFSNLGFFFPIKVEKLTVEPLNEYKTWFNIQKKYYLEKGTMAGLFLAIIPRPVYKFFLKIFSKKIEGRNIFAVYKKTSTADGQ